MFERFTEWSRQAIVLSQEAAREFGHDRIRAEHVLLGLLREEGGVAARTLHSSGITTERVREHVLHIVGPGGELKTGQIPFTPRTKRVLELSLREALSLGHNFIGTEHILLGLLREDDDVIARLLSEFEVEPQTIRDRVIGTLSSSEYQGQLGPPRSSGRANDALVDDAVRLLGRLTYAIETQLGRPADAGDLLVILASLDDGLAARTLGRLNITADALRSAADEARGEGGPDRVPRELRAEIERVRADKEAKVEAQEFDAAADLRDTERRLTNHVRAYQERQIEDKLPEIRLRLGLDGA